MFIMGGKDLRNTRRGKFMVVGLLEPLSKSFV